MTARVLLAVHRDELIDAGGAERDHLLPKRRPHPRNQDVVGRHRAEHRAGSVPERVQDKCDGIHQRAVEIEQPGVGRSGTGARDISHIRQTDLRLGP